MSTGGHKAHNAGWHTATTYKPAIHPLPRSNSRLPAPTRQLFADSVTLTLFGFLMLSNLIFYLNLCD